MSVKTCEVEGCDHYRSSFGMSISTRHAIRVIYTLIAWEVLGIGISIGNSFFVGLMMLAYPLVIDYWSCMYAYWYRDKVHYAGLGISLALFLLGVSGTLRAFEMNVDVQRNLICQEYAAYNIDSDDSLYKYNIVSDLAQNLRINIEYTIGNIQHNINQTPLDLQKVNKRLDMMKLNHAFLSRIQELQNSRGNLCIRFEGIECPLNWFYYSGGILIVLVTAVDFSSLSSRHTRTGGQQQKPRAGIDQKT